jgi:small subunit ribosomal protein S6
MPQPPPIYDLTLLLSMNAPDEQRAKILADVEAAIPGGGGSIERRDDWGMRPLTYPIQHQSSAEYHLLQFAGPVSLLDTLNHTLRITDGVLRFRIIKVIPGTPPPPDSPPPVMAVPVASPAAPVAVAAPAAVESSEDE